MGSVEKWDAQHQKTVGVWEGTKGGFERKESDSENRLKLCFFAGNRNQPWMQVREATKEGRGDSLYLNVERRKVQDPRGVSNAHGKVTEPATDRIYDRSRPSGGR